MEAELEDSDGETDELESAAAYALSAIASYFRPGGIREPEEARANRSLNFLLYQSAHAGVRDVRMRNE